MGLEIQFLGSGDAFGSGGRMQTCILVKSPERKFLIDCGASAMIGIKKYGIDPNTIDLIILTHLHGDHFGGIPFFMLDAQLVNKRTKPLTIIGPPGTKDRIRAAMEIMFPGSSQTEQKFTLHIIEFDLEYPNTLDNISITPYIVKHPSGDPSLALRIEYLNKIIAYTGDTEWVDNLVPLSKDADVLIAECYFYDKEVKYHLNYKTLLSQLHIMNPKKVILTHMSDDMLKRTKTLESDFAEDGKIYTI